MTDQDKLLPEMPERIWVDCNARTAQRWATKPVAFIHNCTQYIRADLCPPDAAARIAELEKALRWYADRENYLWKSASITSWDGHVPMEHDKGQRARDALGDKS